VPATLFLGRVNNSKVPATLFPGRVSNSAGLLARMVR